MGEIHDLTNQFAARGGAPSVEGDPAHIFYLESYMAAAPAIKASGIDYDPESTGLNSEQDAHLRAQGIKRAAETMFEKFDLQYHAEWCGGLSDEEVEEFDLEISELMDQLDEKGKAQALELYEIRKHKLTGEQQ
jgi:hypothetical protein